MTESSPNCKSLALAAGAVGLCGLGAWALYCKKAKQIFLTGEQKKLQLIDKKQLAHDTYRMRFALESPDQVLGLPMLKHVLIFGNNYTGKVKGEWNGKPDSSIQDGTTSIMRPYTPVTGDEVQGTVDFVLKLYRPDVAAGFSDGGKLTRYLDSLMVGDQIKVSGPVGKNEYLGGGRFVSKGTELPAKQNINLVIGGSGITPALRVLFAILDTQDPAEANLKIRLIFANKSVDDIICRDLLESCMARNKERLTVWYTVDTAPTKETWEYSVGYLTMEMMKDHLFPPGESTVTAICGPPPMLSNCLKFAAELGHEADAVFNF